MIDIAIFILSFVVGGLILDAAFYWRFMNMMGIFYVLPSEATYTRSLFPRVMFLMAGAALVAVGAYPDPTNANLIIIGGAVFAVSSFYPHWIIYRSSTRVD